MDKMESVHMHYINVLLLYSYGQSTHSYAYKTQDIFCLPPNTTHLTQPLDKGCFGPLKVYWKEECQTYLSKNPGKVVTRYQFSEIFPKALAKGMTMKNIVGGFKTTGIFPVNREAIMPKSSLVEEVKTFDTPSLPKGAKINFYHCTAPFHLIKVD